MPKNDGGPAFPCDQIGYKECSGMSLRDYFAAAALMGQFACLAHPDVDATADFDHGIMARESYKAADAMLAEREKETT